MITILLIIIFSVLLILQMLYLGGQGRSLRLDEVEVSKEDMLKFLVWKAFYCNPNDPRGWVPKAYGYGWTVNFRTMKHIYIFIFLILITLSCSLYLVLCNLDF